MDFIGMSEDGTWVIKPCSDVESVFVVRRIESAIDYLIMNVCNSAGVTFLKIDTVTAQVFKNSPLVESVEIQGSGLYRIKFI